MGIPVVMLSYLGIGGARISAWQVANWGSRQNVRQLLVVAATGEELRPLPPPTYWSEFRRLSGCGQRVGKFDDVGQPIRG